jgi:tetratricopeptide (TPR) repeat protein
VAEPIAFKYRAFLSYSHADTRWAKRLHRRLESFRIDKELVGRETAQGTVPDTLRPIFRDRDDFSAGHTLTGQTFAALDSAAALIVLCSPSAAKSHYVNEESRIFKSRHSGRPVIPVIIEGTPGDPARECFVPALRFRVTADGTVTNTPEDMLAADVRDSGDGPDLALAKVVARLLDLQTDDVFRRAERARRRAATLRNAMIGGLALLSLAAMGSAAYAWRQLKTNEAFLEATLKRATEIVNTAVAQAEKFNVPRSATLELLSRAEGLFDDMARLGRPTPALQRQKAWMLIEFARNYEVLGDVTKRRERAEEAHRIMAALAADPGADKHALNSLAISHVERASALVDQGNTQEALENFSAALELGQRIMRIDPGDALAEQNLATYYRHVGALQLEQGNAAEAVKANQASLDIVARIAAADPKNVRFERDLAVAHNAVGEAYEAQSQLPEALNAYRSCLAIMERLGAAEPGNLARPRDLSLAHGRVADVLVKQEEYAEAVKPYQASVAIDERLAGIDPTNTRAQRDLSISYNNLGTAHLNLKNFDESLRLFNAARVISERLAAADPHNLTWQRGIAISHSRIGNALEAQGDHAKALESREANLAISERLVSSDPKNAAWRRDLAVSHARIASVLLNAKEEKRALESLKKAREIMQPLAQLHNAPASWKAELDIFEKYIAELEK